MSIFSRGRAALAALIAEKDDSGKSTATQVVRAKLPERSGYEYGIPDGGLDEYNAGGITGSDRRSVLGQLYDSYLSCPWSWAAVNAIARTITAGGLITDYTADDEDGDKEVPPKPALVLALERLLLWCNEREDMQQLLRGVIVDLLIFGDAYIEVVWLAGVPVALYSLDAPSMYPIADKHGRINGYVQITDLQQRAEFAENEVIHISLDSPRSGIYGVSPTEASLLPITVWLFAAATIKEVFKKGDPANIHVDLPASLSNTEANRWVAQYLTKNLGPRNRGMPILTKGGGTVTELQHGQLADYLAVLDQKRDEILATYGVPPAAAGVIESGNIGGGTGEAQDKMYRLNTCQPIGALVLEKLIYAIVRQGFGITDWTIKFKDIDMRDSKVVEEIRDKRIRNGTWSINRARADVGEPRVDGGDDPVIVQTSGVVLVRDMDTMSRAGVAAKLANTALEPDDPEDEKPLSIIKPEPAPVPDQLAGFAGVDNPDGTADPVADPGADDAALPVQVAKAKAVTKPGAKVAAKGKATETMTLVEQARVVDEQWVTAYRERRRKALEELLAA